MQYIMSRQVNGLGRVFYSNSRELTEPILQQMFDIDPGYFENITDVIVACSESEEEFDWRDDEFQNNVIQVDNEYFMLDMDNVALRRDPTFIKLIESIPDNKARIVEIPEDVEVWLQYREDGSEWFCESHRTWG